MGSRSAVMCHPAAPIRPNRKDLAIPHPLSRCWVVQQLPTMQCCALDTISAITRVTLDIACITHVTHATLLTFMSSNSSFTRVGDRSQRHTTRSTLRLCIQCHMVW